MQFNEVGTQLTVTNYLINRELIQIQGFESDV